MILHLAVLIADEVGVPEVIEDHGQQAIRWSGCCAARPDLRVIESYLRRIPAYPQPLSVFCRIVRPAISNEIIHATARQLVGIRSERDAAIGQLGKDILHRQVETPRRNSPDRPMTAGKC